MVIEKHTGKRWVSNDVWTLKTETILEYVFDEPSWICKFVVLFYSWISELWNFRRRFITLVINVYNTLNGCLIVLNCSFDINFSGLNTSLLKYINQFRVAYVYETIFNIVNLFVSFQLAKFYNIKMPGKTSLRDKLDEDVLDLSLMQMSEVPVTEIVSIVKTEISWNSHLLNVWIPISSTYFSFWSNANF